MGLYTSLEGPYPFTWRGVAISLTTMNSWSRELAAHLTRGCCALIRGQRTGMRGRITGANQRKGCVGRQERRKGKCRRERAQEGSIANASARGAAKNATSLATSDLAHLASW